MHSGLLSLLGLAGLAAQASAHGLVTKPVTRSPGQVTEEACGKIMAEFYRADNTSYPEALLRANPDGLPAPYDPENCNLWLCKGFQFDDNVANVQNYTVGQVIDMEVWIRIPHEGYANVSVVDTASNSVIGTPLLAWPDSYAGSVNPPEDQVKFSVEVPDLGDKCTKAGACVSSENFVHFLSFRIWLGQVGLIPLLLQVIQWYWFGQGQTYESCIDFTVSNPASKRRFRRY